MRYHKIPSETINRLPTYLRVLITLSEQGQKNVSSKDLADFLGINPSQIRKDLSHFGAFGIRGIGYAIEKLKLQISKILKLNTLHKIALIGTGNLGSAILTYTGFKRYGFDITAAFDVDPKKIGKKLKNITIEDAKNISTLKKRKIKVAILAIPQNAAKKTADELIKAGVTGILNFSPCYLETTNKVKVITIDIATILARLPYYMTEE